MYEYPLWLLIFVIIPILLLLVWKFHELKKYWKWFILAVTGSIIFALPWDYIAIKERIWYFTEPHIFGAWFLGLPLEEWGFIVFETIFIVAITIIIWNKYGGKR